MTLMMTSPAGQSSALYAVDEGVATITLNRPRAMNAVDSSLATAVGRALEAAANDATVRVVIVTGSGRAFCAGADLKALAQGHSIDAAGHPEWGFAGLVRHWIDKPIIAAVNGFALGEGTELALACDLVLASEDAEFGLPEVRRGLLAGAGGVLRLQRQIPLKRALYLALIGEPISARTAQEWGLVNQVVATGDVLAAALELSHLIAENAPLSVQHTKRMLHSTASAGSDWTPRWTGIDPWEANAEAIEVVFGSRDAIEGPTAFTEKRRPRWEGR